ncbi:hypothetical protein [Ruminococcus sp. FC2018]|uniref:hypothetical protein n=1 Tax=Ruminococcus sp. FC2018 TaxID=1410617 RepID=UPI0012DE1499|nr:hypothetical protein [Ruminococcus sp. FC2018]
MAVVENRFFHLSADKKRRKLSITVIKCAYNYEQTVNSKVCFFTLDKQAVYLSTFAENMILFGEKFTIIFDLSKKADTYLPV